MQLGIVSGGKRPIPLQKGCFITYRESPYPSRLELDLYESDKGWAVARIFAKWCDACGVDIVVEEPRLQLCLHRCDSAIAVEVVAFLRIVSEAVEFTLVLGSHDELMGSGADHRASRDGDGLFVL